MEPTQTRIITPDGIVSDEVYNVEERDPRMNTVTLSDGHEVKFTAHNTRLLPLDAHGKAIALVHSGVTKGICPKCKLLIDVLDGEIECDCQGVVRTYKIITCGKPPKSKPKSKPKRKASKPKKEMTMTEAATKTNEPVVIDINDLRSIGELWVKDKTPFDHPDIEVKTYALLCDKPARKLCFNTYGGTLGKKSKGLASLRLDEFSDDIKVDGKSIGYVLKRTLDDERARLEKSGYSRVE